MTHHRAACRSHLHRLLALHCSLWQCLHVPSSNRRCCMVHEPPHQLNYGLASVCQCSGSNKLGQLSCCLAAEGIPCLFSCRLYCAADLQNLSHSCFAVCMTCSNALPFSTERKWTCSSSSGTHHAAAAGNLRLLHADQCALLSTQDGGPQHGSM